VTLSRLRLGLAGWSAVAFLVSLLACNAALYAYLRHQSERHLTTNLLGDAKALAGDIQAEFREDSSTGVTAAAARALAERPPAGEGFAVYSVDGVELARGGDRRLASAAPRRLGPDHPRVWDAALPGLPPARLVAARENPPEFDVVAVGSTQQLKAEEAALLLWLGLSAPAAVLVSLGLGYVLSRRALKPIAALEAAIARIAPGDLDQRLPLNPVPDEVDRVAIQFNGLLQRLQAAQEQNRNFIRHAAHQIRTPLTLVLGEADLGMRESEPSAEQYRAALRRVGLAAGQMKRRVEELLLWAQAMAGARPELTEDVELDGLVLECADLMRGRAQALKQRLELARVDPVVVRGDGALLREALLELIENACRHGSSVAPIRIAAFTDGGMVSLLVESTCDSLPLGENNENSERQGVGLEIVGWIAQQHGGSLTHRRDGLTDTYAVRLPVMSLS
jgi:two-component system, OmpR family, heavy metal sensor histidine kinase CusS